MPIIIISFIKIHAFNNNLIMLGLHAFLSDKFYKRDFINALFQQYKQTFAILYNNNELKISTSNYKYT